MKLSADLRSSELVAELKLQFNADIVVVYATSILTSIIALALWHNCVMKR